jgi:hypothetical protein
MMAWLTGGVGKLVIAGVAGAALLAGAYFTGRADGAATVRARLAADRITILKDGREIDLETLNLDDAGLCAVLGGC